ncbi:NAD-dependent succinate-semialdehyde dehydrogenase [Antrihabitans spumae]|uniref:NAD-dependent succinate-semialdehyde dehydrogenase n=1 Tax=Antrihabitans spumae TaxID=3373370 RepID=A0ABW7JYD2_9NOCA
MTTYQTVNPATGEKGREFPNLNEAEVADVLTRSQSGYEAWRHTTLEERAEMLATTAALYEKRADELARIISTEMGKPITEALAEVEISTAIFQWYAVNGIGLLDEEPLDVAGAEESVVHKRPIGPLLGVMPWNFPYYQVARFAAPNLMLGNTILLKHASSCPQSASVIEEIFQQAGLPRDAYINIFVSTDQVAEIIADSRVQGVSLTGSEKAGASVAETAGRNLKKVVLELGGSDPFIVLDSDDMAATVASATKGRLSNTGQACNGAKRFIVLEDVYDDFVAKLVASFEAITPGDPLNKETVLGPLSSQTALDDLIEQVDNAVTDGATVLTGGKKIDGPGAFIEPTLLTDVTPDMAAYSEELFGPVAVVYKVASADEAVTLANSSAFGLSGSVWSTDLERARGVADQLDVGMAFVNEHGTTLPGLPFGGVKRSGFGRELGSWGMDEFVNKKLVRVSAA